MLPKLRNGLVGNATLKITAASGNEVTLVIDKGVIGPQGPAGEGVPPGGLTGQVLAKLSDANYDSDWISLSGLNYLGTWNASTNVPTLTSGQGFSGGYYICNVAGSTNLDGITDWKVNDWAVFNGTVWQKIDNTDSVTSVNGQTGAVIVTASDVGAPSYIGTGASGIWGISVTGNAATADNATNAINAQNAQTANSATTAVNVSGVVPVTNGGTGSVTSDNARAALGVPSLFGVGASGTWGISVTGTANKATNIVGGSVNQIPVQVGLTDTAFINAPTATGQVLSYDGTAIGWAAGGSGGGVSKILAGTNIVIDPPTGVGDVTISATGSGSTVIGQTQSVSPYETSIGFEAGNANTGVNNTYLGYQAGRAMTGAVNNVVIGYQAMDVATIPSDCVVIGSSACGTTGNTLNNVIIGSGANAAASSNGGDNTYIGKDAARTGTGSSNVVIGSGAGNGITTLTNAVGIGNGVFGTATSAATGAVAIGNNALGSLSTGAGNVAIGLLSGVVLTTGGNNTCVGAETGKAMVSSTLNTFIGYRAGIATTGGGNTVVGGNVNPVLSSGAGNTFIGVGAGSNVSTGSNNTVIGNGPLPTASTSNTVALYDGVGDLAVLFNDPGAMTFDGTDFGQSGSFLRSGGSTSRPTWTYPNQQNVASIAGNTSLSASISTYFADATAGNMTVTLPPANGNIGVSIVIKRIDSTVSTLQVASSGGNVEGESSFSIGSKVSITFSSDGTNWWISSSYIPPVALQAPQLLSTMAGDSDAFVTFTPVEGATGYEVIAVEKQ